MIKNTLIIVLILALIYLYYQRRKKHKFLSTGDASDPDYQQEVSETISELKLDKEMIETERDDLRTKTVELQAHLTNKETQLNLILDKWNWGKWKPKTASEFIDKFEPWIETHLEQETQLKEFLKGKGASLTEVEQKITTLENDKESLTKEIERLKTERKTSEEVENLELERDEAIREKITLEQELTSVSNRLKLKQQEVDNKDKDIERLKKEAQEKDQALNDKISEWKNKYQQKSKLLDEERLAANKLEEEKEKLEQKVKELENSKKPPIPGSWEADADLLVNHQQQLQSIAQELVDETLEEPVTFEKVLELAKKKKKNS